ncbi:MAG: hypothetical protein LBM04_10805 [Opitutaceae bacterium]|nr:hypothetical protein [Opitutaceae bacterium]
MKHCIFAFGIVLGCALHAAPEAGGVPASDVIVEMPPYEVRADRILPRPEEWLHITVPALAMERGESVLAAPGYYVLSNLSEQNTRLFINELQLRQFAGMLLWPMLVEMQPRAPGIIILDGKRGAGEQLAGINGAEWEGDPIQTGQQPATLSAEALTAGLRWIEINSGQGFRTQTGFDAAGDPVYQTENDGDTGEPLPAGFVDAVMSGGTFAAWVNAGVPLVNISRPGEERLAAAVCQEQMSLLMDSFTQRPHPWLLIGMRRLIASTEVSRTKISFARLSPRTQSTIPSNIPAMAQALVDRTASPPPVMPSDMRAVSIHLPPLLPVLNKTKDFGFGDIQLATALVHFGLYGDNGKHRQKFMRLVERQSAGEEVTDALFKEIFGFNTKKMLSKLSAYTRTFAAFTYYDLRGKLPPMPEPGVGQATQAEVARLQAETFVAMGRFDFALDKLRIAYWRGEREPEMLAALAWIEQQAGSEARARKIIQTLMKLPQPPLRARVAAAKLRLRDALADKPAGAKLSMDEAVEILDILAAALTQGIPGEDACETFAKVMLSSPAQPPPDVAGFLKKAAVRYPNNAAIAEAARLAGASP